jgi:hypothetical protein
VTWTKIGDEFPDECERVGLSDSAVRTHVECLCWSICLGIDGRMPARHVRRFAFSPAATAALDELVNVGYSSRAADG